jgi:hypothetical protein
VLVAASRRAGLLDSVLRLAAPAPLTATVLRLTGLDSRFEIFATVPQALSHPLTPGARDTGVPKPYAYLNLTVDTVDFACVGSNPGLAAR